MDCIEIRVKGRWVTVPTIDVDGKKLFADGRWLKTARVRSEEMMEKGLENPELYVRRLKDDRGRTIKADIFTFTQKPPETRPKYTYPVEWESVAAIALVSFKLWWESLPQETRKNVRRSQKRGVTISIKEFDGDLIQARAQAGHSASLIAPGQASREMLLARKAAWAVTRLAIAGVDGITEAALAAGVLDPGEIASQRCWY